MKTLSCDQCARTFTADTFEDWLKQMQAHYMADHADLMASMATRSREEGQQWMAAARARFDGAE